MITCEFEPAGDRIRCRICGREVRTTNLAVKACCRKPRKDLPGTELRKLLDELGLTGHDCQCELRAQAMDQWGSSGCVARRAEIAGWIQAAAEQAGWLETLRAAARLMHADWFRPLEPCLSIVDEAIRRARRCGEAEQRS